MSLVKRIKEYRKKWKQNNPKKVKKYNKTYRDKNPEKLEEYNKKYYQNNKDKENERSQKWRERNVDKIKVYDRERRKNNPEKVRADSRKRRVLKMNCEGTHIIGEWELLKKQYGHKCPCCGKLEPEIKLEEDHIIPLIKGGSDYIENIQPLCRSCNAKKHTKIIKYF